MRGRKKTFSVQLNESQRAQLQHWLRSTTLSAGLARRARLLLLLEEPNTTLKQAAQTAGLAPRNARKWAQRFLATDLTACTTNPGRDASRSFPPEVAMHLVKMACERPDELWPLLSQVGLREIGPPAGRRRRGVEHLAGDGAAES